MTPNNLCEWFTSFLIIFTSYENIGSLKLIELTFCVDKSNPRKVCLSSGIIFKSFLSNLNFIYSKSINLYPAGITDTIYFLFIYYSSTTHQKNIRLSKIFLVKYQLYYCTFHSYARQMLNGLIHKVETVTFFPFIVSLMILFIYYAILLFTVFAIWMKFHTNTDTLTHVHFLTDVNTGKAGWSVLWAIFSSFEIHKLILTLCN